MIDRINILGVQISAIDMEQALETIEGWVTTQSPNYICVTPAHGVMDCQNDPELLHIFNNSGLTTPDGMGIVWSMKMFGQHHVERVYGPDLVLAVSQRGLKYGWRHYFYGGQPGVAESLGAKLRDRFPDIQIVGHYSPPFRRLTLEEDKTFIDLIKSAEPDILWVGISTPKQERWMSEHVGKLGVPVLAGVGAAFDFLSGNKKQAPRWVQRSGFEWLFRLLSEPKRLWRRYIRYPQFALLVLSQYFGLKTYDNSSD